MSEAERERSHVVRHLAEGRVSQGEAAERLGLCVRQVKRLLRRWRAEGDAGLVNRQRGRASNNRLGEGLRARVLERLRGEYEGFGPTFAAEKLAERDGIRIAPETVRQLLIGAGLRRARRRRAGRAHPPRERRGRFGELVQIDASRHAWFGDRGPVCALVVFIDDATGRLTALRFAASETRLAYLEALRGHILAHGLPLALYSDRHGIFRVNAKDAAGGDGKTEFGRVCDRLGIGSVHASTPQAKGRVERANQTLQDRLAKEMRLRGISTMEAAQAYAAEFVAAWNARFAVEPADGAPGHRPWTSGEEALDLALACREARTLSRNLTFSWNGAAYCVKAPGPGTAMRGGRIEVLQYLSGPVRVLYKDRVLDCTRFKGLPRPPDAEDAKTLDARIDLLVAAAGRAGSRAGAGPV